MARLPFIGRLSPREYIALIFGLIFIAFEGLIRLVIVLLLPRPIINWFYERSRSLFYFLGGRGLNKRLPRDPNAPPQVNAERKTKRSMADQILHARDFSELCALYGYTPEEHVVLTKDGYLLGLHRISSKKGQQNPRPGTSTGNPVVYLHHGLLMNSEVWVCLTDAERALPFVLVEQGFDVWLGNNRCVLFKCLAFDNCLNLNTEETSIPRRAFITVLILPNSGTSPSTNLPGTISQIPFTTYWTSPRHQS